MNQQQITFNRNVIARNREEVDQLLRELENPRIRNVEQRREIIKSLRQQIAQAETALAQG